MICAVTGALWCEIRFHTRGFLRFTADWCISVTVQEVLLRTSLPNGSPVVGASLLSRLHAAPIEVVLTSKVWTATTLTSQLSLSSTSTISPVCKCALPDDSISLYSGNIFLLVTSLDMLKACSRALENHYQLCEYALCNCQLRGIYSAAQSVTIECH